ncbi:hypothetical protein N9Y21_04930 [Gammaproteobacteria bacterium]|nr:hypothetical protein [Gammaproteobacteria bacterium]
MKILLTILVILTFNLSSAELKIKIDHHGNILDTIRLNRNQNIFLKEAEFDEKLRFSSKLLEQHIKHVSEIIPVNSFVVLYGDEQGVINELNRTYSQKRISLSHTGADQHHHPEFFLHDALELDISLDNNQKSIFILQKRKSALKPFKKLIVN